jgi:signal transduction histidine kinase
MRKRFARKLHVPVPDPDEARRRWTLNILLVGMSAISALMLVLTASLDDLGSGPELGAAIFLVSCLVIFTVNRQVRVPTWVPASLALASLTVAISLCDTPAELADGRSLIAWVLIIVIAPMIMPPFTAFAAAALMSILIGWLAAAQGIDPNTYAMSLFFVVALAAWLATRTLERAAREARHALAAKRAVLGAVADGVVVATEGGEVEANPAAVSMLGNGQLVLRQAALQNGDWLHGQRVLSVSPAEVPGLGRVAVIHDKTRQREAERAREAILGTASHELRTPLSVVMGCAEMIKLTTGEDSTREMAGTIHTGGAGLLELVNKMLDRASLEAGALVLKNEPYSPQSEVRKVLDLLYPEAGRKGVTLGFTASDLPEQAGDADRFGQVVMNLVNNAVKFTERGRVMVSIRYDACAWALEVRDTGMGIPPHRLPDIFLPFHRGADYKTRDHQGSGLGLSVTKGLVEAMGGRIEAESKVGEGSTFTVTFPRSENILQGSNTPLSVVGSALGKIPPGTSFRYTIQPATTGGEE